MEKPNRQRLFIADIGGTNSRFGHFEADEKDNLSPVSFTWLKTADADSFEDLIGNLRASGFSLEPGDADIAVIAIAGPVEHGIRSSPPLIPWEIDLSAEKQKVKFRRALLINDFAAQAYSCISPIANTAERVLPGRPSPGSAIGVVGAGTGLGHAALMPAGGEGFIVLPSEGAHAGFPFERNAEHEFQKFLLKKLRTRYITYNDIVSGIGISHIHHFLTGGKLDPFHAEARMMRHEMTFEWVSRFYGRACRNYALQVLALGGIYIAGGVAARNPDVVRTKVFESEFRTSDKMSGLLGEIPVFRIKYQNSGLWGGAVLGMQVLKHDSKRPVTEITRND